jgi:hypothetical protein
MSNYESVSNGDVHDEFSVASEVELIIRLECATHQDHHVRVGALTGWCLKALNA